MLKKFFLNLFPTYKQIINLRKKLHMLHENIQTMDKKLNLLTEINIINKTIEINPTCITEENKAVIPNTILFQGSKDIIGNSRAFFDYIYKYHKNHYDIIWMFENSTVNHNLPSDVKILYADIEDDLLYAKKTKYIILSTMSLFLPNENQITLTLWHGIPLKTIGFTEKPASLGYKSYSDNYFFVTSDLSKLIMNSCFHANYEKMFITGQPRTDCILNSQSKKEDLGKLLNIDTDNYKKIIFYAPTFQSPTDKSILKNVVGIKKEMNNLFYFDTYDEEDFSKYLKKNNILFLIKPHFLDEDQYKSLPENNNIKYLYDDDLVSNNINLYELLKFFDCLITNYSSIYIDYLILNKPIIFIHSTIKEYAEDRGFIFEDNVTHFMPGAKVYNQKDLIKSITKALTNDPYKEKRKKTIPLFHKFLDANSCERIYNIMKTL